MFLALTLNRPLLLEGEAGVGKTELAKVLSRMTGGPLLRLQCYEGLDVAQAVYEWDYAKQLLHLRAGGGEDELRWSATEVLRTKDFAACTAAELAEVHRLLPALRRGASRSSRRPRPARRGQPDLRRTVRRALRTGGDPVALLRRGPSERPRRLVLLVDVSGSMSAYARTLVRFAHGAALGGRRVEVFTLGTRLTRLTRELATHDPDAALARVGRAVPDWSGGTRLGESLRRLNDIWGAHGLARGAVVVVLSDGWDRGEPALHGDELARLRRVAHRILWVNPLKAGPGYRPLAAGMAAALPHVDALLEGHNLLALEALVADLERV